MKFPEIARRFQEAMAERKMTAQILAEKSGVGKSSISHYVNGTNKPHNINAGALASVLGVNPMWLMGFDVNKNPKDDVEKFLETAKEYTQITELIQKLNSDGLQKLIERAEELTELPRYRKDN